MEKKKIKTLSNWAVLGYIVVFVFSGILIGAYSTIRYFDVDGLQSCSKEMKKKALREKDSQAALAYAQKFVFYGGIWQVSEVVSVYRGILFEFPAGKMPVSRAEMFLYEVPEENFVRLKCREKEIAFADGPGKRWRRLEGKKVKLSFSLEKIVRSGCLSPYVGAYINPIVVD